MKRITFAGGSIVTGDAITEALLRHTTSVPDSDSSFTIDVTVLEPTGETSIHTLLLSPTSQLDITDADGISVEDEARFFPVPELPQVGIIGTVAPGGSASAAAADFDKILNEIDDGLGQ